MPVPHRPCNSNPQLGFDNEPAMHKDLIKKESIFFPCKSWLLKKNPKNLFKMIISVRLQKRVVPKLIFFGQNLMKPNLDLGFLTTADSFRGKQTRLVKFFICKTIHFLIKIHLQWKVFHQSYSHTIMILSIYLGLNGEVTK